MGSAGKGPTVRSQLRPTKAENQATGRPSSTVVAGRNTGGNSPLRRSGGITQLMSV
ncbi:hypothetical protein D3C72_868670 [compost metagenome]